MFLIGYLFGMETQRHGRREQTLDTAGEEGGPNCGHRIDIYTLPYVT